MGYKPYAITASVTLDRTKHTDALVVLNAAAGLTVTLPAASGSGDKYELMVGTTVTSNSDVIKVANSTDIMAGVCWQAADSGSSVNGWETGATDDTITMNGTTTGGIVGSYLELRDVATNVWMVIGNLVGSGTLATPLSAAV
jgi:hypothetical protein